MKEKIESVIGILYNLMKWIGVVGGCVFLIMLSLGVFYGARLPSNYIVQTVCFNKYDDHKEPILVADTYNSCPDKYAYNIVMWKVK